jgi:hypothetical protein
MHTLSFGGNRPMRTTALQFAFAVLFAAGCSVDATRFTCSTSEECPSGYHCDLGSGSTAGTYKCANGAAQQKTLTADASRFLLVRRQRPDGSTRTNISAGLGAVTSTPDFVGVRVVASQGNTDLAESQVLADGSVLEFQLPQALMQVQLRVQDDSGHSVPVTGYPERIELSFLGKNVVGNSNEMAAYDAVSNSNSLYPPQTWISTRGAGGSALAELPASYMVLADGGVSPPASYQAMEQLDGVYVSSNSAPEPDRDGGTAIGWEQISSISTISTTALVPPARVGASMIPSSGSVLMYGGAAPDVDGGVVDPAGTWYTFNPNGGIGWAAVQPPAPGSRDPFPSTAFGSPAVAAPASRANTAMGYGGNVSFCTPPCIDTSHRFIIAGGTTSTGAFTDRLYAYGDKFSGSNTYTGWWDLSAESGDGPLNKLRVPNAGMAHAALFAIPAPLASDSQMHAGAVLVGGVNIPSGAGALAWDNIGCQVVIGLPSFSDKPGAAGTVASCTTPEFATTSGTIGFRTGVALAPSDLGDSRVYLFGGNRTGASTPASNGFKNDVWQGTLSVVCMPGGAAPPCGAGTPQIKMTWAPVPVAASPLPPARTNAGLAFADFQRLTVYGGKDAAGNILRDVWELDLSVVPATPQWRQVALDPSPALAPAARTKFTLLGNVGYASYYAGLLISGLVGTSPTMDVWALSKQAPARLLVKAPVKVPTLDAATNMTLRIDSFATLFGAPVYIWDGTAWRFVANPDIPGGTIFETLPNGVGFIQPDSNVYLMFMHRSRSYPGFANSFSTILLDSFQVAVDFK